MATNTKDTIYIDVDDDITSIVGRVQSSSKKIIALVLPKRSTVFQSLVNMKLLKKVASQNDKNIVLITSEASLMPLAGAAGVYVASNLNSKPFIPPSPVKDQINKLDEGPDPKTPIGDVTGQPEESIEVDNSQPAVATTPKASDKPASNAGKQNGKKMKVPNFDKFRKKLLIVALFAVLLIGSLIWAIFLSPHATVTLKTQASEIPANFQFTADASASSVDTSANIVPASKQEKSVSQNEKSTATEKKDMGSKAGGTITFKNCSNNPVIVPAGTGVSSGDQTYITQKPVSMSDGNFDFGGECKSTGSHTASVSVVAQNNGDRYNSGARDYSVNGFSSLSASGSAMTGGSSKMVTVVSKTDVEAAKQRIESKKDGIKSELRDKLKKDGYIPLEESFTDNSPTYNISPAVGSEANEVTVSADIKYSMLGIKEDDIKKLIAQHVKDRIKGDNQTILSEGLATASYKVEKSNGDKTPITIDTVVSVGPDINQDELKSMIAGKKKNEAQELISSRPGIIEASVNIKPSWASKIPKNNSKISITIEDAQGKEIESNQQP